jgi:type II secretory pathway component PulF
MKSVAFYLGLALLFTHELDAMPNHEWQVLPLLSNLADSVGRNTFVIAHIPIFAVIIACIASLNVKTRSIARDITSGFLVAHALLHLAFSGHSAYQFSSSLSSLLIYGSALCGLLYFVARWMEPKPGWSD